jgi:hypothetical protein
MPRFWTHETLTEFVENVGRRNNCESAVNYAKLLVGKKSGKSYGTAEVSLENKNIARMLCELKFEEGDIRENMTFSLITEEEEERRARKKGEAASGQRRMLETIDLDQYLMSPDVLYDAAKLHQRKFLTRSEQIEVDAFLDDSSKSRAAYRNEGSRGSQTNMPLPKHYVS